MSKAKDKQPPVDDGFGGMIQVIDKEFGEGSLITGDGVGAVTHVDTFPSGVISIDVALGCRGIPQGRIIELFGPESSGKTTTCLQWIAGCQQYYFQNKKRHGRVVFIDAEHALDPDWAERIGVNIKKLAISQPGHGEEALRIAERLIKSGQIDLIVIDSVAALVPEAEIKGEIGDAHVGLQARMMSQALRKISGICSKSKTTVVFINQIREKIGVMFGSNEVTPGGRALKFYASIRAEIKRGPKLTEGDKVIGFKSNLKFVKNKLAPPFTIAEFDVCVGQPERPVYGIDRMASIIDTGQKCGIVSRTGSWFSYGDLRLGNGMSNATAFLYNDPKLAAKISNEIYDKMLGRPPMLLEPDSIDDEIIDSEGDNGD